MFFPQTYFFIPKFLQRVISFPKFLHSFFGFYHFFGFSSTPTASKLTALTQATLVIRGCAEEMGKLDSVAGKALRCAAFGRLEPLEPLEPSKMVIFTVKNGGFSYGTWLIYHKNMGLNLSCKHWGCDGIEDNLTM